MKKSTYNFHQLTHFFCCFLTIILASLSSCKTTTTTTTSNKNSGLLDPVIGKNTSPKDTATSGKYNPVTNATNNTNATNTTNKNDTLIWCDTLQQSPSTRIVVCFEKIGNRAIKADTVATISINDNALYTNGIKVDTTINRKLAYQVAIMMPFMSTNFIPTNGKEIPIQSIKALEFYEGVLIALDSLKAEGVSLFVNVFDTQRDTTVVQNLLNQRELQEADLIIGPLTSSNLKIVAKFAKEKQKVLVSPLNSRDDLTSNNPYFIQINPSFDVHSKCMIECLHKLEHNKRIIRDPMEKNLLILALDKDSARVARLQTSYTAYKNDTNARIKQIIRPTATIDINDIKSSFKKDHLNIILMPSFNDEGFIYNSLREIQKLVDKVEPRRGYQIVVIGMDRWRYFSRINFEYYESLNLHFTSEYFTDLSDEDVQQFRTDYKAIYGIGSREFGFKGFDIMLYFGRMLQKYGVNLQAHLWKENLTYRHTKFQIDPTFEFVAPLDGSSDQMPTPIIRNYENQYVNFLRFDNYKLKKVRTNEIAE